MRYGRKYIKEKQPTLLAICFDNPDHVGHQAGHNTPEYYAKLKELDGYVSRIIQAVTEAGMLKETIFIVTADHGGIEKDMAARPCRKCRLPSSSPERTLRKKANSTKA